jgi:hypothetical protein
LDGDLYVKVSHFLSLRTSTNAIQVFTFLPSLLEWSGNASPCDPPKISESACLPKPTHSPSAKFRPLYIHSMKRGMHWDRPVVFVGRTPKARTTRHLQNKKKHKAIPDSDAPTKMSALERSNLRRAIHHHAEQMRTCWRPPQLVLPALALSPWLDACNPHIAVQSLVHSFEEFWDWQDQCLEIGHHLYEQDPRPDYDFEPFEAVFSGFSRLNSLRGDVYSACNAALQARQSRLRSRHT